MEKEARKPLTIFRFVWRFASGLCALFAALVVAVLFASGVIGRMWRGPIEELSEAVRLAAHGFRDSLAEAEAGASLLASAAGSSFSPQAYAADPEAFARAFYAGLDPFLDALAALPHARSASLRLEAGSATRAGWRFEGAGLSGNGDAADVYAYYAPVLAESRRVGTVRVACDFEWISRTVGALTAPDGGCLVLVDANPGGKRILARSGGGPSEADIEGLTDAVNMDYSAPRGDSEPRGDYEPGDGPDVRLLKAGGGRLYAARVDLGSGILVLGVVPFLSLRLPFFLGIAGLLGLTALAAGVVFLQSALIGRSVSGPLEALASGSARVLSGELEALSADSGLLEVTLLADSLNRAFRDAKEKTRQQKLLMESNARIDLLSIDLEKESVSSLNGFRLFGMEEPRQEMPFRDWLTRFHIVLLEKTFNPLLSPGYQERSGSERSSEELFRELQEMRGGAASQREFAFDTLKGEEGFMRVNAVRASSDSVLAACVDMTEEYRTRRELFVLSTRLSYALNATQSVAIFDVSFETMELWASESFFPFFEFDKPPTGTLILPDFERRLSEGRAPVLDPSQGLSPSDIWKKGSRVFKLNLPRSGVSRWIEVRTAETVRGMIGTAIDITRQVLEKQAAQEKAETAQELSRVILSSLTEAVLGVGREGHCVFLNPAAETLLGYSQEDLVGQDLRPIFAPAGPDVANPLARALRDGAPASSEYELLRRKDGSACHVSVRIRPLERAGEFIGAVATLVDVSGLVELSNRFNAILANAVDLIYMTDRDLRVTMVSDSILKAVGASDAAAVLGKKIDELLPPGTAQEFRDKELHVLERNEPVRGFAMQVPYRNGMRWLDIAIIPLRDTQGETIGQFGIARDVTEAYRLDEELRAAKIQAERANQAKSVFLAGMSHEIRTPLNAILGYSQLMEGNPALDAGQKRMVNAISRAGEHLLEVINSILEISKIEAGRLSPFLAAADLFRLLDDIESMFSIRAESKGLSFGVVRASGLPRWILTDVQKLRQILINLLGNAVKFTRKGEVRLTAEVRGGRLSFAVRDTGPGIAEDERKRLFEPFTQGKAGIDSQGGTGLGLAISREYARLLGGSLSAEETEDGVGCLFRCELALIEANSVGSERPEAKRAVSGLADPEASPLVLDVDDSEANRELVRDILVPVGFRVIDACDGAEALRAVEAYSPDAVLMDLIMPGMDGVDAIARLRTGSPGPGLPIIAVTASAFEEDRRRVMAAGANDFIRKPIDREELLGKLGRALGLEYRRADAAEPEPAARAARIDLSRVPEALRRDLRKAAVELAPFQASEVVREIGRSDSGAAAELAKMIERFDFQAIVDVLDGKGEKNGKN